MLIRLAAFVIAFQFSINAYSQCVESRQIVGNTQATSMSGSDEKTCMVTLDPMDITDLVYRSYLFNQDGLLMVFNSFGDGQISKKTGSRDFYFFPRKHDPTFDITEDGSIEVNQASGRTAILDPDAFRLLSISGAQIKISEQVRPDNAGGVEITPTEGLVLDCGFALGQQPEVRRNSKSVFKDSHGAKCEVKNSEVFSYAPDGDVAIRWSEDEGLKNFLKSRCKNLDLSSL
jgi:hypothetical protein